MKRIPIRRAGLMDAARRRTIARELVAIAPDAPWFLKDMAGMLDTASCQQLSLTTSATAEPQALNPEGSQP